MIVGWEVQIAGLRAAMDRDGQGAAQAGTAGEAEALARAIYGQQLAFIDAAKALLPSGADDERITETRKALDRVSAEVDRIRAVLSRHQRHTPAAHAALQNRPRSA